MKDWILDEYKRTIILLVVSGLSLIVSFFDLLDGIIPFDAAWVAIVLCGFPIIKGAIYGLVTEFDIKADVLVSIALVAAVFIGEIFAAGEVAFIMAIGALLEERTVAKARAGIERLIQIQPQTGRVIRSGEERIVAAEDVCVGDTIRVLAGETIPVDGVIVEGQTSINQSVMTGESLPIDKGTGDEVFSGTVNQFGIFEMKATKVGEDSSLQRMIKLVESADAGKAKIVRTADRWATWIVWIALVSALGTWLVTGEVIRSVTILVVFCPCALVLATPTAIMAGIGNATKYGILVRQGDALERLAKVTKIAFDKTGTLTYGKPTVKGVESFDLSITADKLLELVASAELRSEHPLGKAIVAHYKSVTGTIPPQPQEFLMLAGRGVSALVDSRKLLAGNREMFAERSFNIPDDLLKNSGTYINDGCTIIYIGVNQKVAGFVALSDELRDDATAMLGGIEQLGIQTVLLTGDHPQAASQIASLTGIKNVYSNLLPEDKMEMIDTYHRKNELVCMVGDGVNDAPALKKSHVGIAMGGIGSDIAVDAADIAFVSDDIKWLPHLLKLAKKTMNTIHWNLSLSMLLNFAAILLAMSGVLTPVLGALVHNVGSVAVVANSYRLLKWRG